MRTVNTMQARQSGAAIKRYLTHAEIAATAFNLLREPATDVVSRMSFEPDNEILPGWKLTIDVSQGGYWVLVADVTDPCGFAYVSNQSGVIRRSEAIR